MKALQTLTAAAADDDDDALQCEQVCLPAAELQLKDCRLLEKWSNKEESNKEESFQQLVAAVKAATSLHTLGLAHNRLGKHTHTHFHSALMKVQSVKSALVFFKFLNF